MVVERSKLCSNARGSGPENQLFVIRSMRRLRELYSTVLFCIQKLALQISYSIIKIVSMDSALLLLRLSRP